MRRSIAGLGSRVRGPLVAVGEMASLFGVSLRSLPDLAGPSFGVVGQVAIRQIFFTGNQALLLTGLIAFLLGQIVVIQSLVVLLGTAKMLSLCVSVNPTKGWNSSAS